MGLGKRGLFSVNGQILNEKVIPVSDYDYLSKEDNKPTHRDDVDLRIKILTFPYEDYVVSFLYVLNDDLERGVYRVNGDGKAIFYLGVEKKKRFFQPKSNWDEKFEEGSFLEGVKQADMSDALFLKLAVGFLELVIKAIKGSVTGWNQEMQMVIKEQFVMILEYIERIMADTDPVFRKRALKNLEFGFKVRKPEEGETGDVVLEGSLQKSKEGTVCKTTNKYPI